MSDVNPEAFAEFATQDGPGSADSDYFSRDESSRGSSRDEERDPRPEQEAHGGSMAPNLVNDTGDRTAEEFPGERDL
ncbi:hypothetical protein [Actinoplanes sp. NPDC023714]|uniref:hypothetical protein n=1 Tax=Actinoplanes sp. NPDC023714 TaxID=3154322 RepID=UPI0033DB5221